MTALWDLFAAAVACDTAVLPGEHRVPADDHRLAIFADEVAAPALEPLGASTHHDVAGNLIAMFGPLSGEETLFVAYPATHHGNDTDARLAARRLDVEGVEHWVGQGANEGKAPFAALVAALGRAHANGATLAGRVIVAVSTEGSSTNHSSEAMFAGLERLPAAAVLLVGTGNRLALGHRGRADVLVTTEGPAAHSSVAAGAPNPIADISAAAVVAAAAGEAWAAEREGRSVAPYRLVCGPVAPHTMPARCELALDCRYLPCDDIDALRRRLADAVGNDRVAVGLGPVMTPAATDPDDPLVGRFRDAASRCGVAIETFTPPWTFDAGPAHARGVPVVLYGPSADRLGAITAADAVPAAAVREAFEVLTELLVGTTPG